MYDFKYLRLLIIEKFDSVKNFSTQNGVREEQMSLLLNGKASMSQKWIQFFIDTLDIDNSKIGYYFFTKKVKN